MLKQKSTKDQEFLWLCFFKPAPSSRCGFTAVRRLMLSGTGSTPFLPALFENRKGTHTNKINLFIQICLQVASSQNPPVGWCSKIEKWSATFESAHYTELQWEIHF